MNTSYFPGLRGRMGDWAFYSVLMTLGQVAEKVTYADKLHQSVKLSDMIQRELNRKRGAAISKYLENNEDRFFNSLVVAVYGGDPQWLPFENVKPIVKDFEPEYLTNTAAYSLGYLSFNSEEKIFALDGQHRLAGIKKAVSEKPDLANDEVSVLIVAHHSTPAGLQRSRKLFTTLNKSAKAVKKSEIIALDEADVMAIVTRDLVENSPLFGSDRILFKGSSNLPADDVEHITTIENLYDVLTILFSKVRESESLEKLKYYRPEDDELKSYIEWTDNFLRLVGQNFPEFGKYINGTDDTTTLTKNRQDGSGHVLFRPVGLLILADLLSKLAPKMGLEAALSLCSKLPMELGDQPFKDVVWMSATGKMNPGKRAISRRLLLHMLDLEPKPDDLRRRYAALFGLEPNEVELPPKLKLSQS
ncbi:DGQHR domain-containing protein [Brevundimonas goettingensis]|uniref:DGQHR domain-containing protein n=1 Tax=Brevundimonas goettingensis TaxID=2774190 RepID=A0A975C004_9CAUL|nr:DNA sulfur modification protein DndB [Brevundimonas goettingensis]QTC90329.1 DGQHR domain-containing protein [Brevundimonas goettingensis]